MNYGGESSLATDNAVEGTKRELVDEANAGSGTNQVIAEGLVNLSIDANVRKINLQTGEASEEKRINITFAVDICRGFNISNVNGTGTKIYWSMILNY